MAVEDFAVLMDFWKSGDATEEETKQTPCQYVQRIMYSYIDLCIPNQGRPNKADPRPFFECTPKSEIEKSGHSKVICSMIGNKTMPT